MGWFIDKPFCFKYNSYMDLLLVDRVAFSIFGVDIYWYGVIITLAILLDFILLIFMCKKKKYDSDMPYDLILFLVPLGIIGARLFSVIFEADLTILDFFAFRDGGMSIIGAIICGAGGMALYCLIKKKNFFDVADIIVPLLILAQSIGRWGNFFNGEVYGQEIVDPAKMWFPFAVEIGGVWYQALFFYESVLNFIGFILLISLFFIKKKPKGVMLATYLVYYGTVRFLMEGLRQEEYILRMGSLPISKVLSGILLLAGVSIFVYIIVDYFKNKNKMRNEVDGKEKTSTN